MTYVVPTAAQSPCKCAARTKLSHQRDIGSLIPPTLQYTTPPEERVRRIQDAHNTLHNPRREIRIQYAHTALHTPGERTTPTLHYTHRAREQLPHCTTHPRRESLADSVCPAAAGPAVPCQPQGTAQSPAGSRTSGTSTNSSCAP